MRDKELSVLISSIDFQKTQEELEKLKNVERENEKLKQNNSLLRRKVEILKAKIEKLNEIVDNFVKEIKKNS